MSARHVHAWGTLFRAASGAEKQRCGDCGETRWLAPLQLCGCGEVHRTWDPGKLCAAGRRARARDARLAEMFPRLGEGLPYNTFPEGY